MGRKRVGELQSHPENPRVVTEESLELLGDSMDEFGDLSGIVFNRRTGNLAGGNQRNSRFDDSTEVHITKKFEEPTKQGTVAYGYILHKGERFSYREVDWPVAKEKAALIRANKSAGNWNMPKVGEIMKDLGGFDVDFNLDFTGFGKTERVDLGFESIQVDAHSRINPGTSIDEDSIPEQPAPRTKIGDLYQLGNHRLLCGDSTKREDVERLMGGEKADMVFTDPPYNIAGMMEMASVQSVRKTYRDLKSAEWDQNFDVVGAFKSILPLTNGWIYFFTQPNYFGEIDKICREQDRKTSWGTWVKRNPMPCLRKEGWTYAQEFFVFVRAMDKSFNFPEKGHAYNWWDINTEQANRVHPTQKPVSVSEHAISHSSQQGQSVLDLFLGSGSTLIACEKTNRRCFGMEIDTRYCDVIVERWEKYTGQKAVLVDGYFPNKVKTILRKKSSKQV